jgi:hypothetical protein
MINDEGKLEPASDPPPREGPRRGRQVFFGSSAQIVVKPVAGRSSCPRAQGPTTRFYVVSTTGRPPTSRPRCRGSALRQRTVGGVIAYLMILSKNRRVAVALPPRIA